MTSFNAKLFVHGANSTQLPLSSLFEGEKAAKSLLRKNSELLLVWL